jgi:hypothetical protein
MLFTRPEAGALRLGLHHNLVQIAALVYYSTDAVLQQGPDTFKVTTLPDYYVFGVREGQLVTNQSRGHRHIPVRHLKTKGGELQSSARGRGERGESSILEIVHHWADKRRVTLGTDYEGLTVALRTLWWRTKHHRYSSLRNLSFKSTGDEAWQQALREARGHRGLEHPLRCMQEMLVPEFMSLRRFRTLFSNPQQHRALPPSPATHRRWDEVLAGLEAGFEPRTG